MAKKRVVADVLVQREWWNTAIRLTSSRAKPATSELVRVRGSLVGEDFQGIWIDDVPSSLLHRKDVSRPVMMRLLIPWGQIVAVGIIDDPGMKPGFAAETLNRDPQRGE